MFSNKLWFYFSDVGMFSKGVAQSVLFECYLNYCLTWAHQI